MGKSSSIIFVEWLGMFLLAAGLVASTPIFRKRRTITKILVIVICAVVPLIPIGGLTVAEYMLTIVGHLSVTSMVLLAMALYRSFNERQIFRDHERNLLLAFVVAGSLMVFPETFGFDQFNGYQLGFGSVAFSIGLMSISLAFVLLRMYVAAAAIVLGVAAFELQLAVSNNLWDYLIDPALAIYACAAIVWLIVRRIRPKPPVSAS